ncbi:MAG: hypothetical protein OEY01_03105 [Desulfobulbaceae bacterium]|nr:hypothetical protein [Desulfobulbaceae bacterium]HIJ78279.1 hypothetical protein [Deltaproteobacteria bacterium]
MKRTISVLVLIAALLTASFFTFSPASDQPKQFTIGVVNPNHGTQAIQQGFINYLKKAGREQGWEISFQQCEAANEVTPALQQMLAKKVDLIFTVTSPATIKMKEMTRSNKVPGIFALYNPIKSGVIKNLARPEDNLTGVQISGSVPKALDWLLSLAPATKHIFVPIKFDTEAAHQSLAILSKTAAAVGIKITVAEVDSEQELSATLADIPSDVDAIFVMHSILISTHADKIAAAAIAKKIPTGAAIGKSDQGILFSYSPRLNDIGRQAGRLAMMVLQGEAPANIPTEKANYFLGINMDTAQKIGMKISNDILIQTDYLIHNQAQ